MREMVINRFVTGDWSAPAVAVLGRGEEEGEEGGFEDLETGEVHGGGGGGDTGGGEEDEAAARTRRKLEKKARFDSGYDDTEGGEEGAEEGGDEAGEEEEGAAGAPAGASALRPGQELFAEDPWIVEQRRMQAEQRRRNKEFADSLDALDPDARAAVQGYAPGTYVRVVLTQVRVVGVDSTR
jgi:ribosome biogenesis protein BMS1